MIALDSPSGNAYPPKFYTASSGSRTPCNLPTSPRLRILKKNFFKYLFIYILILAAPGLSCGTRDLRCSTQALSCCVHAGSSSPTGDRTWAPCIGSAESYPLDHQGSPKNP